MFNCSAESAVGLLWGLAVSDALMLELWDAMAVALDKPDVGLQQMQLQQVRHGAARKVFAEVLHAMAKVSGLYSKRRMWD
jgi:hypothetical protein